MWYINYRETSKYLFGKMRLNWYIGHWWRHLVKTRWNQISKIGWLVTGQDNQHWTLGFCHKHTVIARFMGPTWGPTGADRTQVGPMLATWTFVFWVVWWLASYPWISCSRCGHDCQWSTVIFVTNETNRLHEETRLVLIKNKKILDGIDMLINYEASTVLKVMLSKRRNKFPLMIQHSYTPGREYRLMRWRYSRLLFTREDHLCANLRVQEQSTNMMSQC